MKNIIEVKNVSFGYGRELVLDNVNLSVEKGDFLALIGPNGSGKSTLIKLLLGLLKSDKGKIMIFDQKISKFNQWQRIGYISQSVKNFNSSFPATVKEIIAANLYHKMGILKILNRKLEEKIEQVLEMVDLKKYKERMIGELSGGQQQRAFIARTLVTDPDLIFLDEPLVGVDNTSRDDFFDLINYLNKNMGISILMVSHDIHVVSNNANKILCFAGGHVYGHDSDDFDYYCYFNDKQMAGYDFQDKNSISRIIPEHQHDIENPPSKRGGR